MSSPQLTRALQTAIRAARAAGLLLRKNLMAAKKVNSSEHRDIKLELDVRCQKLIERTLRRDFPGIAVLGEEGVVGEPLTTDRWVVDPIDGTVNFTYGIPHACISIALQQQGAPAASSHPDARFLTMLGVVYDPFADELFTALRGKAARLNGRPIRASQRTRLEESIVSVGFAKSSATLEGMLPGFNDLVHRVRKIRIMGSAALSLVYVAAGRFDAYLENGIRLWDIAAGGLILECAGGDFRCEAIAGDHTYRLAASNGRLDLPRSARGARSAT